MKKLAKKEVEKHQELNQERLKRENEVKESMKKKLLKQQEKNEKRKQDNLKVFVSYVYVIIIIRAIVLVCELQKSAFLPSFPST